MLIASLLAGASLPAIDPQVRAGCPALKGQAVGALSITGAELVPVGPAPRDPLSPNGASSAPPPTLPEHCRISAETERRTGADGKSYAIRIELRVPVQWNGRLIYQGGGGLNGFVGNAIGSPVVTGGTQLPALAQGYAVVSSDGGHSGVTPADTSFAADQQAKLDYGYAAIGKVATGAKQTLSALTGKRPEKSYFMGCSNGGREALIAAQRYPMEFDGILAANPAFDLTHAAMLSLFSGNVYTKAARQLGTDSSRLFTAADEKLVQGEILNQCDGLDGLKDGMIFNHAQCHFEVRKLVCKPGETSGCVAPTKVEAIERAFAGPRDSKGKPVVGSWPFDAGVLNDGWRLWQVGVPTPDGKSLDLFRQLVTASLTDYMAYPAIKTPTKDMMDVTPLLSATADTAAYTNATSTDFRSFVARGGKLILLTGGSDPIFSPSELAKWYEKLGADTKQSTGKDAGDFSRFFIIPGMNHCGGGPALDNLDPLAALVSWTENGAAPTQITAKGQSFPGMSRPICAYPAFATYNGKGNPALVTSFSCKIQ